MTEHRSLTCGHSVVHFIDAVEGLAALKDESVALLVTSPPYWNYIDYGVGVGTEPDYAGYIRSVQRVFEAAEPKLWPGARVVVNVTNMKSRAEQDGGVFIWPVAFDVCTAVQAAGFTLYDEVVWLKQDANSGYAGDRPLFGSYPYPPTPRMQNSIFEMLYVFTKAGTRPKATEYQRSASAISLEDWRTWTNGVWRIASDRNDRHPATFPLRLADRLVRLYSFVDDTVVDPFAGSGTTVVAAEHADRIGIGYEINEQFFAAVHERRFKEPPRLMEMAT